MFPASPIKMRVLCSSAKPKIRTFATALGEAFNCQTHDVPPAYPCEKERLVILVVSLKGEPSDTLRRFCAELTPARAYNVVLVVDNKEQTKGIQSLISTLKEAGTNVMDDIYYLKSPGLFSGAKISFDERTAIVRWAQGIVEAVKSK